MYGEVVLQQACPVVLYNISSQNDHPADKEVKQVFLKEHVWLVSTPLRNIVCVIQPT